MFVFILYDGNSHLFSSDYFNPFCILLCTLGSLNKYTNQRKINALVEMPNKNLKSPTETPYQKYRLCWYNIVHVSPASSNNKVLQSPYSIRSYQYNAITQRFPPKQWACCSCLYLSTRNKSHPTVDLVPFGIILGWNTVSFTKIAGFKF